MNADAFASTGQEFLGYNMFAYCCNSVVGKTDPLGFCYYNRNGVWSHDNWEYMGGYVRQPEPNRTGTTVSFGVGTSGYAGIGGGASSSLAFDSSANVGIVNSVYGGASTPQASANIFCSFTNAKDIYALSGPSYQVGGSVALFGFELGYFQDPVSKQDYYVLVFSLGISVLPAELHASIGNSTVSAVQNIIDLLWGEES